VTGRQAFFFDHRFAAVTAGIPNSLAHSRAAASRIPGKMTREDIKRVWLLLYKL
jgi:hypothetical protein